MTSLSPAARTIWTAFKMANCDPYLVDPRKASLAAALQAAADQEKLEPDHWEGSRPNDYERGWNAALRKISRIAAELEGQ
jgi:hypothetical protein